MKTFIYGHTLCEYPPDIQCKNLVNISIETLCTFILTRHCVECFNSNCAVCVLIYELQELQQRPLVEQVELHLWHVLGTAGNELSRPPSNPSLGVTETPRHTQIQTAQLHQICKTHREVTHMLGVTRRQHEGLKNKHT